MQNDQKPGSGSSTTGSSGTGSTNTGTSSAGSQGSTSSYGTTGAGSTGKAGTSSSSDEASRLGRAKEFVSEKYSSASEKVKDGYSAVKEKVDDIDFGELTEQMRGFVRTNPGKALLISVGVGFVLGMLLRRGNDDE